MKRYISFFGVILFSLLLMSELTIAQRVHHEIRRVVIDAGHGGRDPGAVGRRSKEKDIVLAVALKTGGFIEEYLPDVEVIYTRKSDVFVELFRRAQIANDSKADLFISIHCNSTRNAAAYGSETFVMGLHKSEENLEVAKKENAAILLEDDYLVTYGGFDPTSPEAHIIFSLYQHAYLDQSLAFASKVQSQFRERVKRHDRGVKQAGFLVLYKVAMPGVLIELGFISNPREELFMMSEDGQTYLASAIFRAFRDYKAEVELAGQVQELIHPPQQIAELPTQPSTQVGEIRFRVQFSLSPTNKPTDAREFRKIRDVRMYFHEGLYKYTSGNESSLDSANLLRAELVRRGFKDAFVVAFRNEERITIDQAVRMLKQDKE